MFITHCLTVTLYLHNFDLFRTCRTSRLLGNWQDVNWHDASRGHSAIAEFLVKLKFSVLHRRENVCCAIFIHAQPLHLSAGSKDGFLRFWKCGPEYRSLTPLFALPMVSNVLCWFIIIINYILEWVWICYICSCISHLQWVIVSTDCINFLIYFTFIVTSVCLSAYLSICISQEPRVQSSPNFPRMLSMAMARSSSGDVIHYVLLVFVEDIATSRLNIMAQNGQCKKAWYTYSDSSGDRFDRVMYTKTDSPYHHCCCRLNRMCRT